MTQTNTAETGEVREVFDAICEAIGDELKLHDGEFAIYRDITQISSDGRDFADYAGRLTDRDRSPRFVTSNAMEAARLLVQIKSDASLGGHRYGEIKWSPNRRVVKDGVTHVSRPIAWDRQTIVEITRSGGFKITKLEG